MLEGGDLSTEILEVKFLYQRKCMFKNFNGSLAGVAQWIEYQPVHQKVAGSIPSLGMPGFVGQIPSWGHVRGN